MRPCAIRRSSTSSSCDVPASRARASSGSASKAVQRAEERAHDARHGAPRGPLPRAGPPSTAASKSARLMHDPARLEQYVQHAAGCGRADRSEPADAAARTSARSGLDGPGRPLEIGHALEPASAAGSPSNAPTNIAAYSRHASRIDGDWCVVREHSAPSATAAGGSLQHERRGREHSRQARRRPVARIVRARHRLPAPEVGRERLGDVGRDGRFPRLAGRGPMAFALPAHVAFDLVARVALAFRKQAVREAQGQRRVLRPRESRVGAGPRRAPARRRARRRARGRTRRHEGDPPAIASAEHSAAARPPMPRPRARPDPVEHELRPARRSPARAASSRDCAACGQQRGEFGQGLFAVAAAFAEPARGGHRAAADAGATVQVDRVSRFERTVEHREDARHGLAVRGHAVVDDRFAQVFDASAGRRLERQQRLVRWRLLGLGQVDETRHAGFEEATQPCPWPARASAIRGARPRATGPAASQ